MRRIIDEFNDYNIVNPDGLDSSKYNDGKIVYKNDTSDFVDEYPTKDVGEKFEVKETFDSKSRAEKFQKESKRDYQSNSISNASTASSAVSSAATSIGSSLGAFAGIVASAVATIVIIVAVFISTMTINLSLVMANTDSIVVQLDISGAQDEDFEEAIIATIESSDGEYQEQVVTKDTLYVTFNNLKPGKEYFVSVKNKNKTFVEKSFFTLTQDINRGQLETYIANEIVHVSAMNVALKSNEFYTITVKNAQGEVVFTKDSKNPNAEFTFTLSSQMKLYFSLSVSGSTVSVAEIDPKTADPEYDYTTGTWDWADDYSSATLTFEEIHGLEPLVLQAQVTSEVTKKATCEGEGERKYIANVTESYGTFYDEVPIVIPALGHIYEEEIIWNMSDNPDDVTAQCILICQRDGTHTVDVTPEVTYVTTPPDNCGEHEIITYTASVEYQGKVYSGIRKAEGEIINHEPASPSDVSFPNLTLEDFDITTGEYIGTGKATYVCAHCGELIEESFEVTKEYSTNNMVYTLSCDSAQKEVNISYQTVLGDGALYYTYDSNNDGMTLANLDHISITNLSVVTIPETVFGKTVKKIGVGAFMERGYTVVTVPSTIVEIEAGAFEDCTSLTNITFEGISNYKSQLTTIGSDAFKGCSSLQSIELPGQTSKLSGVITIPQRVFTGCSALESVTLPGGAFDWFGYYFGTTSGSGLTGIVDPQGAGTYYIPASLKTVNLVVSGATKTSKTINAREFKGITTIESVTFNKGVYKFETISESAFEGCTGLKQVDFTGVRNIGASAFKNCGLTSVDLDNYFFSSLGAGCFAGCKYMTSLSLQFIADTSEHTNPSSTASDTDVYLLGYLFGTTSGSGLTAVSQKSKNGTAKTYYIPSGLTSVTIEGCSSYSAKTGIYEGTFMNCTMITSITIGDYVDRIEPTAFTGTTNLATVEFTDSEPRYQIYNLEGTFTYSSDLSDPAANVALIKDTSKDYWLRY